MQNVRKKILIKMANVMCYIEILQIFFRPSPKELIVTRQIMMKCDKLRINESVQSSKNKVVSPSFIKVGDPKEKFVSLLEK